MAALINPLAAHLFANNAPQFDLSRQQLLELPLQEPQISTNLPRSLSFRPTGLPRTSFIAGIQFPHLVIHYYTQTVPQADKLARIGFITDANGIYNTVAAQVVSNEDQVKLVIDQQAVVFHQISTTSINGQPSPSDVHSQIERFLPGMRLAGWSDYLFRSEDKSWVSAVMEGKNPWKVTPAQITEVLNGMCTHADFVFNERDRPNWRRPCRSPCGGTDYGYMVRNQVRLGIISTLFGSAFLWRQDQGQLYMTTMFGCRAEIGGGYTAAQGFYNHARSLLFLSVCGRIDRASRNHRRTARLRAH